MSGSIFLKRPRSNIVPGQRLPFNVALIQGGASPDNSYQNLSTESGDVSQRNRSGRDYGRNSISFDILSGAISPADHSDVSDITIPSPHQDVKKTSNRTSSNNNTMSAIVTKKRPVRNRFPPTRFWLGERAIYNGYYGEFLRVSPVFSEKSLKSLEKDEESMRKKLNKRRKRTKPQKATSSHTRNIKNKTTKKKKITAN
ncbi:unnamed protein product [Caenorhabditis brenneri]